MIPHHTFDVAIIGGGLAGLCAAIHLSKAHFKILLIEKNSYPKHKVCGEYISNEVLPYLNYLEFNPFDFGAKRISKFELTTHNNQVISSPLPLGGFGMSRYCMDLHLQELAKKNGVIIKQDTVNKVNFEDNQFNIKTKSGEIYRSKLCIGAFGKRSNIDINLQRDFIKKKSPYLGVKIHVSGTFDEKKVALHNFEGGYCGVSKVENNDINLCYITSYKAFKTYKSIDEFQEKVLFKNSALKSVFKNSKPKFERPLTISQISFESKQPVEHHMIMCGDAAGMIHPLCGNGMAMAIRSAYLASNLIIQYLEKKISRTQVEQNYTQQWRRTFGLRLKAGHFVAYLFRQNWLAPKLLVLLKKFPFLLPKIIQMTHGKPIKIE